MDQVKTLEDESQHPVAEFGHRAVIHLLGLLFGDNHFPFGRDIEQSHNVQHRAFAATRRAHHREEFSFVDIQVDPFQGDGLDLLGAVDFRNSLHTDQFHGFRLFGS